MSKYIDRVNNKIIKPIRVSFNHDNSFVSVVDFNCMDLWTV